MIRSKLHSNAHKTYRNIKPNKQHTRQMKNENKTESQSHMLYSLTIHNCPSVFVISSFLCNSIIYQTNGGRKREENSRKNYTEIKAKISIFIFVVSSASYHCVCLSVCMYVIFNTFRHTKAKKKTKTNEKTPCEYENYS